MQDTLFYSKYCNNFTYLQFFLKTLISFEVSFEVPRMHVDEPALVQSLQQQRRPGCCNLLNGDDSNPLKNRNCFVRVFEVPFGDLLLRINHLQVLGRLQYARRAL